MFKYLCSKKILLIASSAVIVNPFSEYKLVQKGSSIIIFSHKDDESHRKMVDQMKEEDGSVRSAIGIGYLYVKRYLLAIMKISFKVWIEFMYSQKFFITCILFLIFA